MFFENGKFTKFVKWTAAMIVSFSIIGTATWRTWVFAADKAGQQFDERVQQNPTVQQIQKDTKEIKEMLRQLVPVQTDTIMVEPDTTTAEPDSS